MDQVGRFAWTFSYPSSPKFATDLCSDSDNHSWPICVRLGAGSHVALFIGYCLGAIDQDVGYRIDAHEKLRWVASTITLQSHLLCVRLLGFLVGFCYIWAGFDVVAWVWVVR